MPEKFKEAPSPYLVIQSNNLLELIKEVNKNILEGHKGVKYRPLGGVSVAISKIGRQGTPLVNAPGQGMNMEQIVFAQFFVQAMIIVEGEEENDDTIRSS